tara:strand:- start:2339 stop:3625 length:1287 start_codon:yes stop_codon:yes gene_type:complete
MMMNKFLNTLRTVKNFFLFLSLATLVLLTTVAINRSFSPVNLTDLETSFLNFDSYATRGSDGHDKAEAVGLSIDVVFCGSVCVNQYQEHPTVSILPVLASGSTGPNTSPGPNQVYALSIKLTDASGQAIVGAIVKISDDDNDDGDDNDDNELYYGIDGVLGGISLQGTTNTGTQYVTTTASCRAYNSAGSCALYGSTLVVINTARAASESNSGKMTIKASYGTLSATKDITVRGAASTFTISGPDSLEPGQTGIYTITSTDVNGNTPSVYNSNGSEVLNYIVTNLGETGSAVSTSDAIVFIDALIGGTITITAPTTGGSGVLAVDQGNGILTYKNISFGLSATTTTSTNTSAIALSTGWNLIYWAGNTKSVSSAVTDSVISVYGWNPTTQSWKGWFKAGVDVPGANDLPDFETGGVYWVYSVVTGSLQ